MSKPKNLQECVELVRKKEQFTFTNVFSIPRNTVDGTAETSDLYSLFIWSPLPDVCI
jgi:hypothetical protein